MAPVPRPCPLGLRPRAWRLTERADLARGELQRVVERADDLLARLERTERGDHVDHRARGVGARSLEEAGLHLAGGLTRAVAGDQVVAHLARARDAEDSEGGRVDLAVRAGLDRRAVLAHHDVAARGGQDALGRKRELAVARVEDAL